MAMQFRLRVAEAGHVQQIGGAGFSIQVVKAGNHWIGPHLHREPRADTRQSIFSVVHKKALKILDTPADIAVIANRRVTHSSDDLAALHADGCLDENKK